MLSFYAVFFWKVIEGMGRIIYANLLITLSIAALTVFIGWRDYKRQQVSGHIGMKKWREFLVPARPALYLLSILFVYSFLKAPAEIYQ